jgi:SAM-dependent methyltransferase
VPFESSSIHRLSRRARRVANRLRRHQSDGEFLDATFHVLLGRPPDIAGRAHFLKVLAAGTSRDEVVAALQASDEYQNRVAARDHVIPDLVANAPDRYEVLTSDDGAPVRTFVAREPSAFDWIEEKIIDNGYYERPGIWSFQVDLDKRVMAEMICLLAPRAVIEVGCSSGAVLHCLSEGDVEVRGVEISELARARAPETVRDRIVLGDLTQIEFDREFDVAFGLDVFEHVHPGKLDEFVAALVRLVAPGGFVFVNVPAFGVDAVFGEVFPMFLREWRQDADAGTVFQNLQVDARGYPEHGHLIWATSDWWVERFERAGLERVPDIERALHDQYDWYFESCTPARKSFYVFSKGGCSDSLRESCERIERYESRALVDLHAELAKQGTV